MPVNKTACPVADCGKPFTPSPASRGSRVARSPIWGAEFANNFFPPSRLCRNGISIRANGLMFGSSTPKPTPSRKMNNTRMGFTNNLMALQLPNGVAQRRAGLGETRRRGNHDSWDESLWAGASPPVRWRGCWAGKLSNNSLSIVVNRHLITNSYF